ncbi:MAG: hypothetical protein WAK20_05825 [Candidatus Acidiferrum sp.]
MKWKLLELVFLLAGSLYCGCTTDADDRLSTAGATGNQGVPLERTYAVKLVDESRSDSPLKASGQIVFHEELFQNAVQFHWETDITYTNVGTKEILAYEVEIDSTPERGGGFAHIDREDFFFKGQGMFPPGSQQVLRSQDSPRAVVPYDESKQQPVIAKVNFQVRFVEFSDGTIYGGGSWGRSLHDARLATIAQIKELKRAYQDGGDAALSKALDAALAEPDNPKPTVEQLEHFNAILTQNGSPALVKRMNDSLDAAKERGMN